MEKYVNYFKQINFARSALYLFFLATFLKVFLMPVGSLLLIIFHLNSGGIYSASIQVPNLTFSDFLLGVIVAPLLETAVGQYFPISILSKLKFSTNKKVIFSALFFSLLHLPVLEFLPSAFGVGLCLSIGFLSKYEYKKHLKKAFLLTTCIHFLHNLFAFLTVFTFNTRI